MLPNEGVIKWFYYKPNTNVYRNTSNVTGRTEHNVKRLKQKESTQLHTSADKEKKKGFCKERHNSIVINSKKAKDSAVRFSSGQISYKVNMFNGYIY